MQKAFLRKIPLIVAGVFFFFQVCAQEIVQAGTIEWDGGKPLNWADYSFRVLKSKREIALTSVKHSVRGYLHEGVPAFEVKVFFVKADSWTSDTTNVALLQHEQLHFDIGELFRRRIEQRIESLRKSGEKQRPVYRYVIKKMLSDFRNFSNEYDKETRFGNLKNEQERWRHKVWEELKRLH